MMKKLFQSIKQHQSVLALTAILLIAAFLRLYRIQVLGRFIWDEGRDMLAIRQIIVERDLTLMGPYNEIDNQKDFFGVFHYYLMLPALWLANFNPVGPAIFTALLGTAAIALSWVWVKNWAGPKTALTVSALLATSPLVVRYNQWAWNPNTIGFFGVSLLLLLQFWQKKPQVWLSMLAGFVLGLLFQLHYFTIALGAAALTVFWLEKHLSNIQKILHTFVFSLSWLLPNLTFIIFDLTHQGFYRQILAESFSSSSDSYLQLEPWLIPWHSVRYLWLISAQFWKSSWLGIIQFLTIIFWLIKELTHGIKSRQATATFQLAVSWLAFLLIAGIFPNLINNYHSAFLWLGLPLSLSVVGKDWWQNWSKQTQVVVLCFLIVYLSLQNRFWRQPRWSENMTLVRQAGQIIAQDYLELENKSAEKLSFNVASLVDSDTRATRFRYFVIATGAKPLSFYHYPDSKILYVVSPHPWSEAKQNPAWELDKFRKGKEQLLWENRGWRVYRVRPSAD
ncbi:MAG: hypothetical protein GF381_02245 [Candidatus Pacebacteria bacterium]|nr:hypothetical protein [Candidatus Paceibacterota bacterium]